MNIPKIKDDPKLKELLERLAYYVGYYFGQKDYED